MLLEIPTVIHTGGIHQYLPLTVRLTEACAETLVKLSYTVRFSCKSHPFCRF